MKKVHMLITGLCFLLVAAGCNKWLDARPQTLVAPDKLFSTENGYEDAMYGVYTTMAGAALYGDQLTMSFLDVLAQQYNCQANPSHQFYQAAVYNYQDAGVKARIDNVWDSMYYAITNVNNILLQIDGDKDLFQPGNYQLIKGEAIGLRAFMHFDLLRLFGASYLTDPSRPAIPYVKTVSGKVTPLLTVSQVLDSVISELTVADSLLAAYKTVNNDYYDASNQLPNDWKNHRQNHFNYWAAEATLARAFLYKGDKVQALLHASNVINSGMFTFQTPDRITNYQDRTFIPEQVFALSKFNLNNQVSTYFKTTGGTVNLGVNTQLTNTYGNGGVVDQIYEINAGGVSDIRYARLWELSGTVYFCSKFWQDAGNPVYINVVPLIRLPEMYYIAAECADPTAATGYLNAVRHERGLSNLPDEMSQPDVQNELLKEYQKEYYAEGQLFYYYKRTNSPQIRFSAVATDDKIYVLPLPDAELQYRN
ncbi:SusD family protein [Chitinophaga costaii]|uniref:SusD family protein n=1 Tax=Chitinophaga costaii TaxID=1335309 RepID=A0A1C4AV68_9BACT|nr:RagB/SusD family nutrient uptake outer membrane protein [Chitinophaga costaii]PUZ26753.1 RagB/SusD family nutrient uptake outer membrane protein [Chitinophaga costaii]SCB98358.1 SusD family protein [Chitinophaga costaii]